jgi:hypothetical protein
MSDTETQRKIEHIVGLLLLLSDEDRLEVFGEFCRNCGTADPRCQCGNDE